MKNTSLKLLVTALSLLVSRVAFADLRIVATVPDLAAISKEVGGDKVSVSSLALSTQDPHFVDARPSLALELSRADLLVAVGMDLEVGWLRSLQTGSRNGKIQRGAPGFVECNRFITPLGVPTGQVDRSQGDIHPGGNPHYLYDPRSAPRVARGLAAKFAQLDPANAAAYRSRAEAFAGALQAKIDVWQRQLARLRGAHVLAYHASWIYLANWLGLVVSEHLEPRPGIPPSPSHVTHVIEVARSTGAKMVLQETFYPDAAAKLIAARAGAKLARLPAGTDFAHGQTYAQHMQAMVDALLAAAPTANTP